MRPKGALVSEQSVRLKIQAKDEASPIFQKISGEWGKFQGQIAGAAGVVTALRMGFAAVPLLIAQGKAEAAAMSGNVEDMLRAQIGVGEATEKLVGQIPLVGSSIAQAMRAWGDRAELEATIKRVQELRATIAAGVKDVAGQWQSLRATEAGLAGPGAAAIQADEAATFDRMNKLAALRSAQAKALNEVMVAKSGSSWQSAPSADAYYARIEQAQDAYRAATRLLVDQERINERADAAAKQRREKAAQDVNSAAMRASKDGMARELADRQAQHAKALEDDRLTAETRKAMEEKLQADLAGIRRKYADKENQEAEAKAENEKNIRRQVEDFLADEVQRAINAERRRGVDLMNAAAKAGLYTREIALQTERNVDAIKNRFVTKDLESVFGFEKDVVDPVEAARGVQRDLASIFGYETKAPAVPMGRPADVAARESRFLSQMGAGNDPTARVVDSADRNAAATQKILAELPEKISRVIVSAFAGETI